ncbi:hypothetical protein [Spirillospora sp. NPDC047279]|uniref:hypothetical protein n=1 Tax=Spirillospora sp. NPDC047279 TaxID=3155478 RepID=UPI003400E721
MRTTGMRRRGAVAAAAMTAAVVSGGCGAQIPVQLTKAPPAGAAGNVGGIAVRNLFVLGSGPGGTLAAGAAAPVYFALAGRATVQQTANAQGQVQPQPGGDVLQNVTSPDAASSRLVAGPVSIRDGQNVRIGPEATVLLEGLARPLSPADNVKITLSFKESGSRTFDVPVLPPNGFWSSYSPAPASTG